MPFRQARPPEADRRLLQRHTCSDTRAATHVQPHTNKHKCRHPVTKPSPECAAFMSFTHRLFTEYRPFPVLSGLTNRRGRMLGAAGLAGLAGPIEEGLVSFTLLADQMCPCSSQNQTASCRLKSTASLLSPLSAVYQALPDPFSRHPRHFNFPLILHPACTRLVCLSDSLHSVCVGLPRATT
ncbi:unnamed protein product [Protopolystoma xenopodis]|uniref:Uncharacterized protein n=1 Tax=Protopolystoma xenopodis TaxID=117903 RepID=A0A448WZ87_9PLAT|nr:unnamed protein product [Protopolystoma xenopodis]